MGNRHLQSVHVYKQEFYLGAPFMCIRANFCRIVMLLLFPSTSCKILQARQNFASPNFCLGSLERFGAEQTQIPEFPHAYTGPPNRARRFKVS
jgi:hypothetical protein